MTYKFKTSGVCPRNVSFDINDGIVSNIAFDGGCDGNHKGIAALAEGKNADEVINALSGIRCGFRKTSCPDQLAESLKKALSEGDEKTEECI